MFSREAVVPYRPLPLFTPVCVGLGYRRGGVHFLYRL